ncbi:hypothetical protein JHK82_039974 [Glycine max]|nr:hypothetical protein JHK82_039974 [Glycine max]
MLLLLQLWKGPLGASFTKISEKENHMVVQSRALHPLELSLKPSPSLSNKHFLNISSALCHSHRTTTSTTATSASFDLCVNVFVGLVAKHKGSRNTKLCVKVFLGEGSRSTKPLPQRCWRHSSLSKNTCVIKCVKEDFLKHKLKLKRKHNALDILSVTLTNFHGDDDITIWIPSRNDHYSVKSAYYQLLENLIDNSALKYGNSMSPRKLNIFFGEFLEDVSLVEPISKPKECHALYAAHFANPMSKMSGISSLNAIKPIKSGYGIGKTTKYGRSLPLSSPFLVNCSINGPMHINNILITNTDRYLPHNHLPLGRNLLLAP